MESLIDIAGPILGDLGLAGIVIFALAAFVWFQTRRYMQLEDRHAQERKDSRNEAEAHLKEMQQLHREERNEWRVEQAKQADKATERMEAIARDVNRIIGGMR
ncbi:MAG: hypothetical protein CMM93_08175 [Rickettsiales bacterium]|nr:hypothetical protein [Rickettsiales bacterium]|tara:strand:- start:311 stop:619 length:309 start_codon:yes stop_codon:yes gene_type:complete